MVTFALLAPAVLDFLKAVGKFISKHWRGLILIGVLIATHALTFNLGKERADGLWITKYNEKVAELNARIAALELSSVELGDEVDGAVGDVITDLDSIEDDIVQEAAKERASDARVQPTCRSDSKPAGLNTPLPKSFVDAWSDMNEVGAKHNPYTK